MAELRISTLADHYDGYDVRAWCTACKHHGAVNMPALAALVGWNTPLRDAKARLKCNVCGRKDLALSIAGLSDPDGVIHRARRVVIEASTPAVRSRE